MRKLVASTTIAASVLGGGAVALTLAPTGAGAQSEEAPVESEADTGPASRLGSRLDEVLDGLVEDGTLDQEQRDAVEAAIRESRPDIEKSRHHRHRGPGHHLNGEVLEELGLEPETVREGLRNGATLGEIAEANGSSAEDLIDAITEGLNERLDDAVANGRIDQSEADERREQIDERVEDLVNGELSRFGHRGEKPWSDHAEGESAAEGEGA